MILYDDEVKKIKIWMGRLGYSKDTIKGYIYDISCFFNWLMDQEIDLEGINQVKLDAYNEYLHKVKNKRYGGGLKRTTILKRLHVIKLYDRYLQLTYNEKILKRKLEAKESEFGYAKEILTVKEIGKLYDETGESLLGYRDRAILSVFYGCGLRRKEGERLELKDISYSSGLMHVKAGKNYQNRYVPMSFNVMKDFEVYEKYSRCYLANNGEKRFIVGIKGKGILGCSMGYIVKKLLKRTDIDKKISLHNLRHSIATHLLQNGMSLDHIGKFLGHKRIDSTEVYTHIVNENGEV